MQVPPDPAQVELLQLWAESIEAKDHYTASHCARVAEYTEQLALAMGIDGTQLQWLKTGSMIHDVGKLAVPAAILNKPGPLDDEEWRIMRKHPEWGDRYVAKMQLPTVVRSLVRHHHERWDGDGYPDRLADRAIPLVARMLCVVDVYDALTSDRAYRPAMTREDALAVMLSEAGSALDPSIYRTFRRVLLGDCRAQVWIE
ncbi:MAG: HD-GYP domain-containing protein [Longimicrobiales bacterium]